MRIAGALVFGFVAACATTTPPVTETAPPPSAPPAPMDASPPVADASADVVAASATPDSGAAIATQTVDSGATDAAAGPSFEITLSRSMCYGVCPAYTVSIRADGTVTYDGDKYVKVHGTVVDHVSAAAARTLANRFDAAGFDGLSVPQSCPRGMVTDNPTFVLTYVHDKTKHVVNHYAGNSCAPKVLADLEDAVDRVANTERWVRCGKGAQGYCNKP